jgi:hypothetical protein
MTDRELLELAAKAAGITLQWNSDADLRPRRIDDDSWATWHPLEDDGDALRLAVKLNLLMMLYPFDQAVRVTRLDQPDTIVSWGTPPDAAAATRRAIVRAAAEIGKSMDGADGEAK